MGDGVKTVLVVDDEPKLLEVIKPFLESRGFVVLTAENGRRALDILSAREVSLVLLDLMLPEIPGEQVCMAIRRRSRVPIIMLTAKADEEAKLEGLCVGADDYITKPFSLKELAARIDAVLRRASGSDEPLFGKMAFGGGELEIDFGSRTVKKNSAEVKLTPSEFRLLETLAKRPGRVFTRDDLISCALGSDFDGYDRTVDTHIKNLRQKIEDDPKTLVYIQTVYGVGYRFGGG